MTKCDYCKQEIQGEEYELQMDGTDDIYNLSLCKKCYGLLSSDYYSPEMVDEIIRK